MAGSRGRSPKEDLPPRASKGHRWKPGESGNPNGRPKKGQTATGLIRQIGEYRRKMKEEGKQIDVAYLEKILLKLYELAAKGDVQAIKTILSYHDGLPIQRTELTGAEGKPFMYNPKLDDIK